MADSTNLNGKENGTVVANTPYEETVTTPQGDKTDTTDTNGSVQSEDTSATENAAPSATENKEETKPSEESAKAEEESQEAEKKSDEIKLAFLDKDFVYQCMSVPTYSKKEYRMVTFIILWARRNKVKYEFDDFGNIYLTKGELGEGEFYPCVTSHLDTVQSNQEPYIYASVPLDLKTEIEKDGSHKISVDSNGGAAIGIGADDKCGICICLSMFDHLEKIKACFFLDEESGCIGSNSLDKDWFNDVGYVIGYDSPDLYRAAWACSGVKLFSYEFYSKYMKEVCDRWGLTSGCFFSEPYTDVKNIREKTELICMNFGNGGYLAHSGSEYCVIEDMDQACGMGLDLIDNIGCTRHTLKHTGSYSWTTNANSAYSYKKNADGTYERVDNDDTELLQGLGDNTRRSTYGYGAYNNNKATTTTTTVTKKEDELKFDTVKYIVNRYDSHILAIKEEILASVKDLCEKNSIDFTEFEKTISEKFSDEIKF